MEGCIWELHTTSAWKMDVMNDSTISGGHPALTDEETGLPNRLHFDTVFNYIFQTGPRGCSIAVLMLEVDGYAEWAAGVDSGELVWLFRSLGNVLEQATRKTDIVARTDHTRFTFGLVECNLAGAVLVADRIDGVLDPIREETGLGFSLGCAVFDPEMEKPADILQAAGSALRVAQEREGSQTEFHR